ncbi:MAG: HAMP domain-containing histidine kinase [Clostridia bacterium]|nr:HAMP domain-containing histidine kinase [Clostridia bacterium]
MEQRLRQQRNRLCFRVTLILLAVWIAVSAAYCAIILHNEKSSVQNRELENLSNAERRISSMVGVFDLEDYIYLNIMDLIYYDDNNSERNWDSQIIVIDDESSQTVLNTANKLVVKYGIKISVESTVNAYGFLDYNTIRNALSGEQYKKIENLLNIKCDDERHYEIVCTKFRFSLGEFIPLELKAVLTRGGDEWYISDEKVDTFTLEGNYKSGSEIYECSDMLRNTVPKDFLLGGAYSVDYISELTEEQREKPVETVSTGFAEYIFYASDFFYLNDSAFSDDEESYDQTDPYSNRSTTYVIQYAKKINLLQSCRARLGAGIAVIFVFFFAIGFILCLMIWKIVKVQTIQEQKREDLTNALAHDIKTPLFVISGYAYSLKENIDDSERDTYIDKIIDQTDAINALVHKMLNLSKLNSDKAALNRTEFDVYELVKEISDNFVKLPDKKTIKLTHSGNNLVNADRELIKTAVGNLIENAVKYSLPESVIEIDAADKTLSISNQSEPLTKTELKQIWQPYVRKDKSRAKNGNGLGLSIVKSIFDLHAIECEMKMKDTVLTCCVKF